MNLDGDDEITGINVTPLVDVMLVLLVIFMVTATYIVNQSINVNLPKADTGEAIVAKNLVFIIDRDSNLFLNGQPVKLSELSQKIALEQAKDLPGPLQALIAADKDTPHGVVIGLIDTVRRNGVTNFAINVEVRDINAKR